MMLNPYRFSGGGGGGSDPLWPSVRYLLHMDGANGSQVFVDETGRSVTAASGANITTAAPLFGTGALSCDRSKYLNSPNTADFLLDGEFTIELAIRFSALGLSGQYFLSHTATSPFFWAVAETSGATSFDFRFGSFTMSVPHTLAINTWYRVALTRDASNVCRIFVDGVKKHESTEAAVQTGIRQLYIGNAASSVIGGGNGLNGMIDELRFTRACRYIADYTPAAAPFPNN